MTEQFLPTPGDLGLSLAGWRPGQDQLLLKLTQALQEHRQVVVDAPPGLGKTVVAVALARLQGANALILTATKALQSQYADAPTFIPAVTGRRNHPCLLVRGATAADGPCLAEFRCPERDNSCPYYQQRDEALRAPIVVANYALVLADSERQLLGGRQILICDEAHLLEQQLANHLGCRVEPWITRVSGLALPPLPATFNPLDFKAWGEEVLEKILPIQARLRETIKEGRGHISRQRAHLLGTLNRLERACRGLLGADASWVVSREPSGDGTAAAVLIRPTKLARLGQQALFYHVGQVVFMSGSFLSEARFRSTLGLGDAAWIRVSSPIPAERRPIVFWPVDSVSKKNSRFSLPRIVRAVDALIEQSFSTDPPQKGIAHTGNNTVRDFLVAHSEYAAFFFVHQTDDRAEVFDKFRAAPGPAVLVSPSALVGEDFPGDQARWQAILKVPYPSLGDSWVKERMRRDPGWYVEQAAAGLVQACGRVARSPDDYGVTYILDGNFHRVFAEAGYYLPAWFWEGLEVGQEEYGGRVP